MDQVTAPAAVSEKTRAGLIYISFVDDEESPGGSALPRRRAKEERDSQQTIGRGRPVTPPRRLQERLKLAKYQQHTRSAASELRPRQLELQREDVGLLLWVDWTSLPDEIVWQVFSYLDVWSLIQVGQSSKTWRRISQDQYIGTTLDFSKFKAHLQDEHFALILESIHAPRLKTINLHGCSSVTARAIARIPDLCPSLTSLLLSGCLAVNNFALYCLLTTRRSSSSSPLQLEQKPPARLTNRRDIRQWHLTQLNQWNRGEWRPMVSLTVLRLSYCSHVSDKALEWVLRCCPNLEELYLSGCPRITDQSCQLLAAKSTTAPARVQRKSPAGSKAKATVMTTARASVRLLDLTGCYRITVQGLVSMLSSLTTLTTLYAPPCLGRWDAFTDARLWLDSALAFPHLETLHLSGMTVKEDTITETLPKRLASLVALDLSGSKIIGSRPERPGGGHGDDDDGLDWTDGGVGPGADDDEVDRRDRRHTEDAWAGMLATMPHLREVNLRACAGVRHDVLADLQTAFPLVRLSF